MALLPSDLEKILQEETKISGYWQGISIPTVYINIQKEK